MTTGEVPFSHEQRGLLYLHELAPDGGAYNLASAIQLANELDVDALRASVAALVERHEPLRCTFSISGPSPVASVRAEARLDFEADTRAWTDSALVEHLADEVGRRFDLHHGPLLRVRVYRTATSTVLLLVAHAIIADARTLELLARELGELYHARLSGNAAPARSVMPYSAYARAQAELLAAAEGQRLAAYWKTALAGEIPLLDLPLDHPRPRLRTFKGGRLSAQLDTRLVEGLARVAAVRGVDTHELLLAAYASFVSRYAGKEDVVIGCATPGRGERWHDAIGPFENMVAVRTRVAGASTLPEVIGAVRDALHGAVEHQALPFQAVVDLVQPPADAGRAPIFQIAFAVDSDSDNALSAFARAAWPERRDAVTLVLPTRATRYDLTLHVTRGEGVLQLALAYNRDLFEPETVQRMLRNFTRLLAGVVENPDALAGSVPVLSREELELTTITWNDTARPYPDTSNIYDLVAAQVERTPDLVAVEFEGSSLTYRELDTKVNGLALHLRELGVGPDVLVGICVDRSVEMLLAILAVLEAGGGYVPLDPAYPADRLAYMVRDSRARLVLSQDQLLERMRAEHPDLQCVDVGQFLRAPGSLARPPSTAKPDNVAYVIYTSGSTGMPKGVMVPHVAVVNTISWVIKNFAMGPGDRMLQSRSPSFDVSIWEIFGALYSGATLVIGRHQDPESLARIMLEERITLAAFVPSEIAILLGDERFRRSPLRVAGLGSEALPPALAEKFMSLMNCEISNNYAPTETIVTSTYWKCYPGAPHATVPIGRPIANVSVYVLDTHLQPVPIGVLGELYVGGVSLARGYLGRPDLTAEKFLPDPYSTRAGARMYRTGDVVRWTVDGAIEFIGRADDQVKIRGFRVELGEIETVLSSHPGVREGVVVAAKLGSGDRRLIAHVVPQPNTQLTAQAVRAFLKERLPDYMVPSGVVVRDAMPLAPTGKVDRKALAVPTGREILETEYVAPRTPTERLVAGVFAEILEVDRVGLEDNFFELGGNSLLATKLSSRVRDTFKVDLPLRTYFEHASVAALAAVVDGAKTGDGGRPDIQRVSREADLELSFAQQRQWFLDQYEPDSPVYNESCALRLAGRLEVAALERALDALVARHESLRTRFVVKEGRPVQVIDSRASTTVPLVDITGFAGDKAAEAERLVVQLARQPFDLARGPLIRVQLLRLAPDEHWLAIVMHHIIGDGWSLGVLRNDLAELYASFTSGAAPALAPLEVHYADFAAWQRQWLTGQGLATQLGFWKTQLAGMPALLDLPTDRPRPKLLGYEGAKRRFELSPDVVAALTGISRAESATLFHTLLAAFQILLHRYSGLEDIAVGSPVANRNHRSLENLIGFFVNTLVMRTDLSGEPTFREALRRVREMALGALGHQDVPFEKLVEELAPQRSLSYAPLVQVMFVMEHALEQPRMPGVEQTLYEFDIGISKFDITLFMEEGPGQLRGVFEYNTALFDTTTIDRMIGHFQRLLEWITRDPDRCIAELPILGETERHHLVHELNATAKTYAPGWIHERIEQQVDSTPDAIALELYDEQLTYRELDDRANQLAHFLREHGAGPEVLVGVAMERSIEMVLSLVAILKAGAAYVPIDPGYPADRLAYMVEDSRPSVLLIQGHLRTQLPATTVPMIAVDEAWPTIATRSTVRPAIPLSAQSLAYMIYTSGSTGRPKGAMNSHAGIANRLEWMQEQYGLDPTDRVLQKTPFSFDVSVWEFFWPLMYGAKLVVAKPEGHKDPSYLVDIIVKAGITTMHFVPSMLAAFLEDPGVPRCTSLRRVMASGEALPYELVERFHRVLGADLHNLYGPTEAAVDVSHWTCARTGPAIVPIGRPIANTQLYVLDRHMEPVPIMAPGEIHIGGINVGRGYWGRPSLTAEKFVPDPFTPGARLYKTGDLGRVRPDGSLEYLGRIDHQVKLRGFRIELGEIEAGLMSHPSVHSAVVVLYDAQGDKRLVGYVAPTGAVDTVDVGELRAHLRTKLPEYMVPAVIMVLDALPLSPNGKIDRKLLPPPVLTTTVEYVAPRSSAERTVATIFEEILRTPSIGATDDFFMRGGHSLLATQVVSRLRSSFGVELPLRTVFEAPTVASLAARVEAERTTPQQVAAGPIPRLTGDRSGLSFAQERLWFLDQLEPGTALYNVPGVLRLTGPLDVEALRASLDTIVARHDALRTTFGTRDGKPVQIVSDPVRVELPSTDVSDRGSEREAIAMQLAIAEARRTFDLGRGPLMRAHLFVLGPEEHWLFMSMHHIVTDGWSYGVLWHELGECYRAIVAGRDVTLPPLSVQYADFAAWQRSWLAGSVLDNQLAYWKRTLEGAPSLLELPTDRPRPALLTFDGSYRTFELSPALTIGLRTLTREVGGTLFMTLLAAFNTLLHRYSGQTDIVVGSPVANRTREETEALIGFFVNTLVMRTNVSGNPTFRELLERVKEVALAAYAHQDVPFEKLVAELEPVRSLSYAPVFQVMFALQNAPNAISMPSLETSFVELDTGTSKFDLSLFMEERGDALFGTVEYNTALFDAATIDRLIGHFERLVSGIVAEPSRAISTLPVLGEAEYRQLVVDWNATTLEYPGDKTVHELFAEQVARTPDAIALEHEGTRLSYRELDRRTDQLANHLRSLGVGVEDMVAIFCERSLEMCIGMIAVHKAGGAYVPLDPNYPEDRIAFIQEDTRCPVILTQQSLVPRLPPAGSAKVVQLDADAAEIAKAPATPLPRSSSGSHLSHIIYTSGSTGRPKGVAIEHHSVVSFCYWARGVFSDHERSGVLFSTSICFDLSVFELFVTLAWGGRVVLVENALALPQLAPETNVILVNSVPSVIAAVLKTGALPASVETVNLAGEPLKNALVHQLYGTGTVRKVVDLYGPSETTTYSTFTTRIDGAPPSIGVPLANTQVYVLDAHRQLVPRGVAGELYIGGDGVAREYLGRPELTAEKFVANPFAPGRMYRTGDLVRWLPNGTLEYVGRIDHQVKIRGFRIELGEIEARMGQHGSVRETVVLAREDVPGDKRLVAYVVARPGASIDEAELRTHIKQKLPDYMVPSAFVVLDKLPLTPNGKIDRKALPAPELDVAVDLVPPATPTEFIVANIFAEILHVPAVGANDDFFARGGHSLLATQVISRVRSQLGIELPLRALFQDPTVARFAARLDATEPTVRGDRAEPITRVDRTGELALSFAQRRMWFLDVLEPGSPFYHLGQAVRLHGPLDIAALERSVTALVARHEALRTTFPTRGGEAIQVIAPALDIRLPVTDLSELEPSAREAEVKRLYLDDAQRPFDLSRGPLVRGSVLRLGEVEHVLLLAFHHIVYDGWSADVMWRELSASYAAFAAGEEPALAPLPIQYPDFAAWQRRYLAGDVYDRQLRYWRAQLQGAPSLLELPTDRARPPVQRFQGHYVPFELPGRLAKALHALSRQESVTLFVTLLSAFQTLLYRYSRQDDICVGSPVANRNRSELEGLIGFFVNTLVLRADLSGAPTFRDLLARVREVALGAYEHQDIPFEKLVEELRPERTLSHSPLFQVVFVLKNAAAGGSRLGTLRTEPVELDNGTAKFDLTLFMEDSADSLRGGFEYRSDLWERSTIERMIGHFTQLLESIVADPNRRVDQLQLVDDAERHRLVVEWNARTNDHRRDALLHELVEAQAASTPDAIAVHDQGVTLTYRELDERATALARHLRAAGVQLEHVVALLLERSLDTIVAHLAVLKAGAAYLPIDPSTPRERMEFMLEDAGAQIVLLHARTRAKAEGLPGARIAVDGSIPDATAELPRISPANLAYVIYTSGSTGKPKGVMIAHEGIVNLVAAIQSELQIRPDDRLTSMSSPAFDALQLEVWPALASGACVDVIDDETRALPDRLWTVFRERAITGSFMPTPLAELALEAAEVFDDLSLRYIYTGGDRLRRTAHAAAPFRLVNMYGPTETSVVATAGDVAVGETVPSIGRQLENVTCYVLDEHLEPVPTGVAGELFVGGISVARGYLRRPELTAEKFVPDPFSATPGARLYRTGDLVRFLPDGRIDFLGRTDHQVKIRGLRIELGEIEASLARLPGVREAIVLARGDGNDKRLIGFVAGDALPDAAGLQAELKKTLPEYMVPSAFVVLAQLPQTQNGKVDRAALLAMSLPASDAQRVHVAPRTRTELELARIFGELLRVPSVSVTDDFFSLGGHSLLAVQLFAMIESRVGAKLPVSTLFRASTVEALAREIDNNAGVPATPVVALRPKGARPPLVCVHAAGGTVLPYQALVTRLASDRPVFGIEARGLEDGETPIETIRDMAASYADALTAAYPTGPLHLLGWSFGGVVALELAAELAARGREVVTTTMIDTFAPRDRPVRDPDRIEVLALYAKDLGLAITEQELRGLGPDGAFARVVDVARDSGVIPAYVGDDRLARRVRVFGMNLQAYGTHEPRAPKGRVVLVRAEDGHVGGGVDPSVGWGHALSGFHVVVAPGDHHSMVTAPHVQKLAEIIDDIIVD